MRDHTNPNRRLHSVLGLGVTTVVLAVGAAAPALAAGHGHGYGHEKATTGGHNPPGNNGTVFIHDVAGDQSPHNVPHVSCQFYADFFGFDAGQQVTVSFAGQAPTGKDTALGGTWTGEVSSDDAGGAGNDFDLELPFTADDLGVTALGAPHPQQGYHVKMTVATNEPGGKKSKVFWIEPCPPPPAVSSGRSGGTGGTGGSAAPGHLNHRVHPTKPAGTPSNRTGTPPTAATHGSLAAGGRPAATVLGTRITRGSTSATPGASLPFTGAKIAALTAAGILAVGTGTGLAVAGRRRRAHFSSPG